MKRTVRLGPLALLLTVVAMVVTVLSLLALSTARGDLSTAQRYADSVKLRYSLEIQGQEFLQQAVEEPSVLSGLDRDDEGVIWKTFAQDGLSLNIGLQEENNGCRVTAWVFARDDWQPEEELGGLWTGE